MLKPQINFWLLSALLLLLNACNEVKQPDPAPIVDKKPEETQLEGKSISPLATATFHAIIATDTNDVNIGESVKVDLNQMTALTKTISERTGLRLNQQVVTGQALSHKSVTEILTNLSVTTNDVVMFYYSGHGFNKGSSSRWPSLKVDRALAQSLDLDAVVTTLNAKHPRFFIAMADACNNYIGTRSLDKGVKIEDLPETPDNYRRLFLNYRGHIIASAASPTQLAFGNSNGGLFTTAFLKSLTEHLASNDPDWHNIMKDAEQPIEYDSEGKKKRQDPQSEIDIELVSSHPTQSLSLRILPNNTFQVDQSMQLQVTYQGQESGYLWIWDINSAGQLNLLFPNSHASVNAISPDQDIITVPDYGADYRLAITEPRGSNQIVAVFTKNNLQTELFEVISTNQLETTLQQLRQQLTESVGETAWSMTTANYQIQ